MALVCLLLGYLLYGTLMEKVFGADGSRQTPCFTKTDGVDYIPMPTWKVFLIQFLNIAGTGPIFGAIMGILYGPAAYLWIVLGCVFAGAVHDYLSGMMSLRMGGLSLPEVVGSQLGGAMRLVMRVLSLLLMLLVGAVFVTTPAGLLSTLTSNWGAMGTVGFWTIVIFLYYVLATVLPINQVIGRVYPVFGFALLAMAVGVGAGVVCNDGWMPELTDGLAGFHPKGMPVFPMLCITIACGAISGFHATQSPMMARCMKNERLGRPVFYGAMIVEGVVALIWAAAASKFAGSYAHLSEMVDNGGPAVVVNAICQSWLGTAGAVLAVLGVVAAPITSGDTALRSARLIAADFMHASQQRIWQRLLLSLPIFALAFLLIKVDFDVLWRYFAWFNQTLGTITLWAVAVWLTRQHKCFWVALVPAVFMTVVTSSYILTAPEGFQLPLQVSILSGFAFSIVLCGLFFRWQSKQK